MDIYAHVVAHESRYAQTFLTHCDNGSDRDEQS